MAIRLTEKDLSNAGLAVDPATDAVVPVDELATLQPDAAWDAEKLTQYIKNELAQAELLERDSMQLSRRSTVHLFRAGHGMSLVRSRLKSKKRWVEWQKENRLSRTSVWEAIELYSRAKTEDAVADLTRTEAKAKFEIVRRKPTQRVRRAQRDGASPATPPAANDPRDGDDADEPGEPDARSPEGGGDGTQEHDNAAHPSSPQVGPGSGDSWQKALLQTWTWGEWRIVDNPALNCPAHYELWHGRALIDQACSVEEAQQKAEHRQQAMESGDADRWARQNPLGQKYTTRADGKEVPYNGACQFFHGCRDFALMEHGSLEFFNAHNMKVILTAQNPSVREQLAALFAQ